jgi:hypothetical protein
MEKLSNNYTSSIGSEVGSRIGMFNVPTSEREALEEMMSRMLTLTEGEFPEDLLRQQLLVEFVALGAFKTAAPGLARVLARTKAGRYDCVYITGLPKNKKVAPLLTAVLGRSLGQLFNYKSQNGGRLVMQIVPDDNSMDNTNTTRAEFDWHSDDAWVLRDLRVVWICLFGVVNPPGTNTVYAPILPVLPHLSQVSREWLFSKAASVRAPLSFGLGADVWSGHRSILSRTSAGDNEIAWPKYATKLIDPNDPVAHGALHELAELIDRHAYSVAVDPGCFLALNNLRGLHKRTPIGPGDRLLYRVYARESLDALRQVSGESGPIFDIKKMM